MPTPVVVPLTEITRAGVAPPTAVTGDTVNGHFFTNDGLAVLSVANSAGTTGTVTITLPNLYDGQAVTSRAVSIPAAAVEHKIGPFPVTNYGNPVNFTVSATTLTLRAYHISTTG
jgi:hypothetical protein